MTITASQVKELRERTGLGMMECKQALVEANGDGDAAIEILRKKAGAKVEKKAARTAAEGVISIYLSNDKKTVSMVEVNSETDFVAKEDKFQNFANAIAERIAKSQPDNLDALTALPLMDGAAETVSQAREALVSTMGENMNIRRFLCITGSGNIGTYVHGSKIGVVVDMQGGSPELARDVAMHIAASRPEFVNKEEVPQDNIAKEKEIFIAQAKESGKPDNIIEKMVEGRVNKYLNEITLLGQPFVKDPDTTVEKLLKGANATVKRFYRYEVGEGIEKAACDFASEVMAQVKGS